MISPEARERLASLMDDRRLELGLRWRDVAEAGGVSYEALRDVRNGTGGIRRLTEHAIETALRWEAGSVGIILAGGDPVPLAAPASVLHLPAPDTPPPPDGFLDAAELVAAKPHADRINARLRELAFEGLVRPGGSDVFGPGSRAARTWDDWADQMDTDELIWLLARLQSHEAASQGQGRNTGLASVHP